MAHMYVNVSQPSTLTKENVKRCDAQCTDCLKEVRPRKFWFDDMVKLYGYYVCLDCHGERVKAENVKSIDVYF